MSESPAYLQGTASKPEGGKEVASVSVSLLRPRLRRVLAPLFVAVVVIIGGWRYAHRAVPGKDFWRVNYWIRRYRNEDLYDAQYAVLLHGNRSLHEVALTFDDGPHVKGNSCATILDTLKRNGIHATFFDVGRNMQLHPDLLDRTLAEGHEVGNHTMNHRRLTGLSALDRMAEINEANREFFLLTGANLRYLRPPGMDEDDAILELSRQMGYMTVSYNVVCGDFDLRESPEFIRHRTVDRTENGSIILLHDYPPTAAALPGIIDDLRAQGYRFVTISEMIAHLPEQQRNQALAFLRLPAAQGNQ